MKDVEALLREARTLPDGDQVLLPNGIYNKPTVMKALYCTGYNRRLGKSKSSKIGMPVSHEPYPALLIRDSKVGEASTKKMESIAFDGCEFASVEFIRAEGLKEMAFNGCVLSENCTIPVNADFYNSVIAVHGKLEVHGNIDITNCEVHSIKAQNIKISNSAIKGALYCSASTLEHVSFDVYESYSSNLGVCKAIHSVICQGNFYYDSTIGENCLLRGCYISQCSTISMNGEMYDSTIKEGCYFVEKLGDKQVYWKTTEDSRYAKLITTTHDGDIKFAVNFMYVPIILRGSTDDDTRSILINIEGNWIKIQDLKNVITKGTVIGKTYSIQIVEQPTLKFPKHHFGKSSKDDFDFRKDMHYTLTAKDAEMIRYAIINEIVSVGLQDLTKVAIIKIVSKK